MTRAKWIGRPKRNEFAPVSCELLVALASTKLTDRAHRVVLAVIATSYGRYREDTTLKRDELATLTGLDHSNVSRALTELEDRGLLVVERRGRGKRDRIALRKTYALWAPETELDRLAESTWRSVPTPRDVVEEHAPRGQKEPLERTPYRHAGDSGDNSSGSVSTDNCTVSTDTDEIVEEHAGPRVKGGSEKNPQMVKKVSGAGPIAYASERAHEAGSTDHWTADPLTLTTGARDGLRPPLARDVPRPRLTEETEASVERLLLALPLHMQADSRRNFFDLAYRGAAPADFHDARQALAACDVKTNPAGFAYRCIANRIRRNAGAGAER